MKIKDLLFYALNITPKSGFFVVYLKEASRWIKDYNQGKWVKIFKDGRWYRAKKDE